MKMNGKELRALLDRNPHITESQKELAIREARRYTDQEWDFIEALTWYSFRFLPKDRPYTELDLNRAMLQTYDDFWAMGLVPEQFRPYWTKRRNALLEKVRRADEYE